MIIFHVRPQANLQPIACGWKMADVSQSPLQYVPFNSCVHPGFWNSLTKVKLDILGLEEKPVRIKLITIITKKT